MSASEETHLSVGAGYEPPCHCEVVERAKRSQIASLGKSCR